MSFQKQVNLNQALGNVGQISKAHHSFCNVISAIAADEFVKVGSFVQSSVTATNENEVIGASGKAISGSILGVVVRDSLKVAGDSTATLAVKKGENCAVLTEGSIFIEVNAIAKKGQYVFLKDTDGSLGFYNASTQSDYTYTGFRVSKGNDAAAAGLIEITTARA